MPVDYSEYHPKWPLISRLIRFKRAKGCCEWCGAENHKPHPKTGSEVVLTVAHIDHDKDHNRFYNLAALCQRCHLAHDREQHNENRKYGRNWKKGQVFLEFEKKPSKYRLTVATYRGDKLVDIEKLECISQELPQLYKTARRGTETDQIIGVQLIEA